jgi:hypothetical protein
VCAITARRSQHSSSAVGMLAMIFFTAGKALHWF